MLCFMFRNFANFAKFIFQSEHICTYVYLFVLLYFRVTTYCNAVQCVSSKTIRETTTTATIIRLINSIIPNVYSNQPKTQTKPVLTVRIQNWGFVRGGPHPNLNSSHYTPFLFCSVLATAIEVYTV